MLASSQLLLLYAFRPHDVGLCSQIDRDVANRLRAANENISVGGFVEWLGFVSDRARNQTAFTVVTYACPARPTDRNVARLGELQDALVSGRVPMRRDSAPRERHDRTGIAVVF